MAERTALTTGANSGIGLATALELARRGLRSVGTVRSAAKAEQVAVAAAEAGVDVETVTLEVTDAEGCARAIDEVRPDVLVNNAGYSIVGAIEDVGDDEARRAIETMVLAPMRLARLALPHMRQREWGRIINVSSIYGLTSTPLSGWYQACKHALEGVSDALRMEVARDRVHVVLIEPGGFKTGIWEETEEQVRERAGSRFSASYERSIDAMRNWQVLMGDAARCASVIADAAQARRPRDRYLVGRDAQLLATWTRLAPAGLRDGIARWWMGL